MSDEETPIVFKCEDEELIGVLHRPVEPCGTGVLIVVGGPQYRVGSHRQFVMLARHWARRGFPVFRFDCRGMGDSGGGSRTFEEIEKDIFAAIEVFQASSQLDKVVVFGLCDAAAAALMFAVEHQRVGGVVLVNPWVRSSSGQSRTYVKHYYGRRFFQRELWQKIRRGDFAVGRVLRDLVANLRSAISRDNSPGFIGRMLRGIQQYQGAVLIVLSDNDLTAKEFQELCKNDARWRQAVARRSVQSAIIEGADHTFSTGDSLRRLADSVADWLAMR
jgi:exosortase A-associated hydrolase 1